jgi:hypothetical protein
MLYARQNGDICQVIDSISVPSILTWVGDSDLMQTEDVFNEMTIRWVEGCRSSEVGRVPTPFEFNR